MPELPPISTCDTLPEDECESLDLISAVEALVGISPSSKCQKRLTPLEASLVGFLNDEIRHLDGSESLPIILNLKSNGTSTPKLVVHNSGKEVGIIEAPAGCRPMILLGMDGDFQLHEFVPPACFDDICEEKPEQFIGVIRSVDCEGNEVWCLRRFDFSAAVFLEGSSTIAITGDGSEENPYTFAVKISEDDGNILEARGDGLYVACCGYGSDPIDEL